MHTTSHTHKSALIAESSYSYGTHEGKRISEKITIKFVDGRIHEYNKPIRFPPDDEFDFEGFYNQFISSESVGKFWHKHFKNQIECKKIR